MDLGKFLEDVEAERERDPNSSLRGGGIGLRETLSRRGAAEG